MPNQNDCEYALKLLNGGSCQKAADLLGSHGSVLED